MTSPIETIFLSPPLVNRARVRYPSWLNWILPALVLALSAPLGWSVDRLPAWLPTYPRSTPQVLTTPGSDDGSLRYSISFTTPDSAATVQTFYRTKFAAAGLTVKQTYPSGTSELVIFEGGDRSAQVATIREPGKDTSVAILAEGKK